MSDPASSLPPLREPPPDPSPEPGIRLPRWVLPAAGVLLLGLVAAVAILLVAGDNADGSSEADAAEPTPSTEYVTAVRGSLRRLTDSSRVTGRILARASDAGDVARIGRMATQQLEVVQAARARVADIQTGPAERKARGALSRATQAHRAYLASLARLTDADLERARGGLNQIRTQARRTLVHYKAFFVEVPSAPKGITVAGLSDLAGLGQALEAKQRAVEEAEAAAEAKAEAEAEAAREREREQQGPAEDEGSEGSFPPGGPTVSNVATTDRGGFVEISASYCDRTPGAVNDFFYTFRVVQAGTVLAENGYAASQTSACNDLYITFEDVFPLGTHEVQVIVDNLTNAVSGSAAGTLSVIN